MSKYGKGIPIFVDLRGLANIPDENFASNASMQRDPRLGISIGVLLSILCVLACVLIIVRHRKCSKSTNQQHVNGNGSNAAISTFTNRSSPIRGQTTGATALIATTSSQMPNCNMDAHEMQTLIIPSSTVETIESVVNGNGAAINHDIHMNGGIVNAATNRHSFSTTNTHSTDDEQSDLSRCGLISSTPKSKHKPMIVQQDHPKSASTNYGIHVTTLATNSIDTPPYRRIDGGDVEAHGAEMATNLFGNDATDQPMKTALPPPNKSVHSIMYNANDIPPSIKRMPNTTAPMVPAMAQIPQSNAVIVVKSSKRSSNASILDDSQQCLLNDPNATESSSASTSSGCVPMDRIANNTNCSFDKNVSATSSHAIVENQRYMRSAALL